MGSVLYDEPIEVPAADNQINAVSVVYLKKPIVISPNREYTIELICTDYTYLYYGSGGISNVIGDKGVEFTFSYPVGSSYGTSVQNGNFPEFYFYAWVETLL